MRVWAGGSSSDALAARTRCVAEQGGMPVASRKHDSRERWIQSEQHSQVGGDSRLRLPLVRACRSLGGCVTSTAFSGPPVRPAEHAGRGSALVPRAFRRRSLTSAVRRRELKGALSRAERRFPMWPIGDDARVPRLPDCLRTPSPSSVLARPASPAPSPSKTTRPPIPSWPQPVGGGQAWKRVSAPTRPSSRRFERSLLLSQKRAAGRDRCS